MFSPLARGIANWEGGIKLDQTPQQLYSDELLLPQILLKSCHQAKSVKSLESNVAYTDGQLLLPKTFITRKGALLLFTPSEELLTDEDDAPLPAPNVYEDGLKLKTVGNLINSVLQFGKEEEQAWEGIPRPPSTQGSKGNTSRHAQHQNVKDKKAFLRFLHYLDSECLTADKHAQPGCDPDFYLDELKSSSRAFGTNRRSEARTPYSSRNYASLLENDNMSDIIQEYIRWNRQLHRLQEETEENNGIMDDEDFQEHTGLEVYASAEQTAGYPGRTYSLSPYPNYGLTPTQSFYCTDDTLRPRTAPLPPAPESPRANPRITSGKRPPPKRALGKTPDHLGEILRADVLPGRNIRRGPSPRLKFNRNTTPVFYPAVSSRGESPEYGYTSRFETPGGLSENWSRADDVIEEVEEDLQVCYTRPVSSVSFRSTHSSDNREIPRDRPFSEEKEEGIDELRTRANAFHSRSESMSSVSGQQGARSLSGRSRSHIRSLSRSSHENHDEIDSDHGRTPSPLLDNHSVLVERPSSVRMPSQSGSAVSREIQSTGITTEEMTAIKNERTPVTSPVHHDDDEMFRDVPRSRSSRRESSRMSQRSKHEPVLSVNYNFEGRGVMLRSKSASSTTNRSEMTRVSRNSSRRETRPNSAPISIPGEETNVTLATLGSEAHIDDVSVAMHRQQAFVKDSDNERDVDSPDEAWPVNVLEVLVASDDDDLAGYGSAAEEVNIDLPSSPSLGNSSFFRLDATWSPALPDQTKEPNDHLSIQAPSETGAAGLQSHSLTPTLPISSPVPILIGLNDEDEVDSIGSANTASQWPSQASQIISNSSSFNTASPVINVEVTEEDVINRDLQRSGSPSLYQETINIERSRPSSPTSELERLQPVSVGESVMKYLESGLEPQERPRSGRRKKGLEKEYKESVSEVSKLEEQVVNQVKQDAEKQEKLVGKYVEEKQVEKQVEHVEKQVEHVEKQEVPVQKQVEHVEKQVEHVEKQVAPVQKPVKPVEKQEKHVEKQVKAVEKQLVQPVKKVDVLKEMPSKTAKPNSETRKTTENKSIYGIKNEKEKDYINIVLNKPKPQTQHGQLGLQGIGKESDDGLSSISSISASLAPTQSFSFLDPEPPKKEKEITEKKKVEEAAKNDLSDLAALISKNKSDKAAKEKKEAKKKIKAAKAAKAAKKNEIKVDPDNIEFDSFNTPEMLEHMDDELQEFIQQQGTTKEPLEESKKNGSSSNTHVNVPQVVPDVSPDKKNAYTPSKPKKPTKQELAKKRADARKEEKKRKDEEKKRKEEEKRQREEELRILKEKEDEQTRAREEAELKQQAIEEEKERRLEEEEKARLEEEEAMEKLKEAKKKAREEREQRRVAEAERRKLEVQRKREEKRKKEEEMREKERELEQTKVDQEKRKQELMEARKRQEEQERLEEERRQEEERLRAIEEEEEQRRLEEEQIREAEEELRRLQEEREYKEQMRRIAEARERKLREEEEKRLRQEEEQRLAIEEERRRLQDEENKKAQEQKKRLEMAKRLEAVARIRILHEAAHRKSMLLKRREANIDRMGHLKSVRQDQSVTRSNTFTYYVHVPRQVWEVPLGFGKQKKGFRGVKRKQAAKKT